MARRRKFGFSFSWKRASGLSGARSKLARKLGVPTTRGGLERKIGRAARGGGCLVLVLAILGSAAGVLLSRV